MDHQIDDMVANHIEPVQVVIDGKRQMSEDTGHESRPEGHGKGCGGLLSERSDFGRSDKVMKRPDGRVVDDIGIIIKLKRHGKGI